MLNGLNADQLEIISIISFDLCNRHFSCRDSLLFRALNFRFHRTITIAWSPGKCLVSSIPQIRSLVTRFSKMAVFSSSDLSKLFGVPLVFLSKSPFKLNIKIKGN